MVAFKAGLWKSYLDDAIREEARLSMNKGTDEEVFDSKTKLPIKTTLRGKYTWEKDGTLVSSEQVSTLDLLLTSTHATASNSLYKSHFDLDA
ncbi:unnamed protein product [Brassica oleracea var. botrytis]